MISYALINENVINVEKDIQFTPFESAKKLTYQWDYPEKIKCHYCHKDANLIFSIKESGYLSDGDKYTPKLQYPPNYIKNPDWITDCPSIGNYFCGNCGNISVLWNQL